MNNAGARIKQRREELGLSMQDVGDRCGVDWPDSQKPTGNPHTKKEPHCEGIHSAALPEGAAHDTTEAKGQGDYK